MEDLNLLQNFGNDSSTTPISTSTSTPTSGYQFGAGAIASEPVVPTTPLSSPAVISTNTGANFIAEDQKKLATLTGTPTSPTTPATTPTPSIDTTSPSIRDQYGNLVDNPNYKRPGQTTTTQPASITMINPATGQSQQLTGNSLTYEQVQALQNQGYAISERTGDIPSYITANNPELAKTQQELNDTKKEFDDLKNRLSEFTISDAELKGQIDAITSQWNARIANMEDINRRREASINTTGIRLGSRYTGGLGGVFGGIIAEEERQGVARIGELEANKQAAIAAAKEAARTKNWEVFSEQVGLAERAYKDKVSEMKELNKKITENNQKIKDQMRTASVDSAIADLLNQGISNPADILNYLNYDDKGNLVGDVTMKEVTGLMKSIQDLEKEEPGIVGEWISAIRTGGIPKGTTLEEYLDIKTPGRALDLRQKQLQIAKLEKELSGVGSAEDPSNILAYSQQYAATGQIPTGLPKGTFGIVASTAKALPKPTGTIVDINTGVTSSALGATAQQDLSKLYNILENTKRLRQLDQQRIGGLVAGVTGKLFGSEAQAKYIATRKAIVDDLSRMQSGAALTPDEVAFYEDYLPGRFSETFGLGTDTLTVIDNFAQIMDDRLKERLSSNSLALYGYSKVKIGGQEYTVGDVITNDQGQSGRILPDGSIATIE